MNKIPTAEELIEYFDTTDGLVNPYDIPEKLIYFAKLHVRAAAETFYTEQENYIPSEYTMTRESILNLYPAENIK